MAQWRTLGKVFPDFDSVLVTVHFVAANIVWKVVNIFL